MRVRTAIPVALALCGLAALLVAPSQAPASPSAAAAATSSPAIETYIVSEADLHGDTIAAGPVAHEDGHDHSVPQAATLATRLPRPGVHAPRAVPGAAPAGAQTSYVITVPNAGGQYLAWNKCKTIRWAIDPNNLGYLKDTGATLDKVRSAAAGIFAEIAKVNGYAFQYAGERPGLAAPAGADGFGFPIGPGSANPDVDIIVGYASSIKGQPYYNSFLTKTVAGAGAPVYAPLENGPYWIKSGFVLINYAMLGNLYPAKPGQGKYTYKQHVDVLRHELGHVMGLAHFENDSKQVMYPTVMVSQWGAGDIGGLKALAQVPCPA